MLLLKVPYLACLKKEIYLFICLFIGTAELEGKRERFHLLFHSPNDRTATAGLG